MGTTIATVIGRGHSGTRAIAAWLRQAGFSIGPVGRVNGTNDYATEGAYKAAEIAGSCSELVGGLEWDHDRLIYGPIPSIWLELMGEYLAPIYENPGLRAWKLPECVFSMPWIARAYPEVRMVVVHRDPRDLLLKGHGTDDITRWGVQSSRAKALTIIEKRIESWAYQTSLIVATQRAFQGRFTAFRLSDYVYRHSAVREAVSGFLKVPMPLGVIKPEAIGRRHSSPRLAAEIEAGLGSWVQYFDGNAGPLFSGR